MSSPISLDCHLLKVGVSTWPNEINCGCKLLRMIRRITWWSLKKIHRSIFEYLNDKVGLQGIENNGNLYFTQNGTVKFLKKWHTGLIAKKLFCQIKIFIDNYLFLIIIYILVKFNMFIYSPWNLYGPQTFRMQCYWSFDHHMALQLTTVQSG